MAVVLACVSIVAPLGSPTATAAQECAVSPRIGVSVPLSEPSAADRRVSLGPGPAFGLRLVCSGGGSLVLELGTEVQDMSRRRVVGFLVGGGVRLAGSSWRGVTADVIGRLGYGIMSRLSSISLSIPDTQFGRSGFLTAVAVRLRTPLGGPWQFVMEGAVQRLFIGATSGNVNGPVRDEPGTGITSVPFVVGLELVP